MLKPFSLPKTRGAYRFNVSLGATNWFGVGGPAQVLFKPEDVQDLAYFLERLDPEVRVTVLGVGSNVIVRDGGIDGVVVKLGRAFNTIKTGGELVEAGAAVLDLNLARYAANHGRAALEFFSGIPGTVGGALAMNGGAYGYETKDVLVKAEAVNRKGEIITLPVDKMEYGYRHYGGPEGLIFTSAWFHTEVDLSENVLARIEDIQAMRETTQPIRERTGGSTFKNPEGHKAWKLIDDAGGRGLKIGGAQISELHCNFMINTGGATAADLEKLGEEVIRRVKDQSGVTLEWEIKRIGRPA